MIRGVIELSRALGFSCIAEGVESDNQLGVLDALGCESAQGFLFARPERGIDVAQTLRRLRFGRPPSVLSSIRANARGDAVEGLEQLRHDSKSARALVPDSHGSP